jgi:hypothetical protein
MPDGWRELLRPRQRPPRPLSAPQAPGGSRDAARLAGLLKAVATSGDQQHNSTLYWAACRLREMLDQGAPESWAEVLVRAGIAVGQPPAEARRTVASGLGRDP